MFTCDFCGKECKNKIQKAAHQRFCKLNPNYDTNLQVHLDQTQRKGNIAANLKKKEKAAQDPLNEVKTYTLICSKCGKEYTLDLKVRDYNRGNYRKTCSNLCAKSRIKTDEEKAKLSEKMKNKSKEITTHICPKCGKKFQAPGSSTTKYCQKCIQYCPNRRRHNVGLHTINCQECGKEIYVKDANATHCFDCCQKLGLKHFQQYDQNGNKKIYDQTKHKLSQKNKQLMSKGIIKPWQSRNITSYPQQFFIEVLKQNNISYQKEKHVGKYFLDFVIQTTKGKIDLQIDGKQHWMIQTQMLSDKIRDEYIASQGYIVYRIKWNQINTEKGKQQMEEKINKFLEFIKN